MYKNLPLNQQLIICENCGTEVKLTETICQNCNYDYSHYTN